MIRIYALAKELKIDNKELVDICQKAGLSEKRSALAGLTDEEVVQVKAYLQKASSGSAQEPSRPSSPAPMQRPTIPSLQTGKVPVLKPVRTLKRLGDSDQAKPVGTLKTIASKHPAEPAKPAPEAPPAPAAPEPAVETAETTETAKPVEPVEPAPKPSKTAPPAKPEVKPEKPRGLGPLGNMLRSSKQRSAAVEPTPPPAEPAAPAPVEEKPQKKELSPLEQARLAAQREMTRRTRVLGTPSSDGSKQKKSEKSEEKPHAKKSLGIHLAPVPTAPAATAPAADENEPAPQKPEVRFVPSSGRGKLDKKSVSPLADRLGRTDGDKTDQPRPERRKFVGTIDDEINEMRNAAKKGGKKRKGEKRSDETSQDSRKRRGSNDFTRLHDEDSFSTFQRQHRKKGVKVKPSTLPRKGDIVIQLPCTVKDFAEATGIQAAVIIKKLMELGYMLMINNQLDSEAAELLVEALELKAVVKKEESLEEQFVNTVVDQVDPPETLVPRAPVVTFLGHVDHGKTSLLDRILHMNVVSGEKGGITQHIRSYRVATPQGDVTFVDTPGHEAFTEMRARGANCTDIAVLVVAADDGVMPQTEEAISHAKAAGVPIVVALNKMDLPGVSRDRVVQELAANDLMPSEWGGDVEIVETSAVTGQGIDTLMETLLMVAELHELKARPDRSATGVAIESSLQPGQGVLCTLLVQNGTLHNGDIVLCGNAYGKVRAMFDTLDPTKELTEAPPSTPVSVLGLDVAPGAGSSFVVLDDISVARQIAEERTEIIHQRELSGGEEHVTLESLKARLDSKTQQTLNIIIRTDVRGSIEAIRKELSKLDHPEVKIKVLQASVGGITEADVLLADASDAIIVGFNVVPDELARVTAEKKKVQIRRYDIIYKLSEDIKAALEGMLKPVEQVKELGRAFVQQIFVISRIGTIAGCRVLSGTIERDCRIRLIRDSRIIGEYVLETLRREKDDAREVREGYECGIKLKGFNDIKEGDYFEAYKIEEVARSL
ncbi:MAG: translation initiation factor IF-2 [Thermoguttaceae bacterium]|nr:translation initiation factor IF-2 [Thermoguttaceae bacterium]